jgi:hypothetical protein
VAEGRITKTSQPKWLELSRKRGKEAYDEIINGQMPA